MKRYHYRIQKHRCGILQILDSRRDSLSTRMGSGPKTGTVDYRDDNATKSTLAVSLTASLNAWGAGSPDSLLPVSETTRLKAGTKQQLGMS